MRLPDLEAWAIFAAVAEARSFTAAAETLGLSKASVSKAVSRLEAHLGQSLFHRTSRRLALTEAGRPLAEHARRIVAEANAAEEAARDGATAQAGRIRLAAPMTFGVMHVAPAIAEFLQTHPGIEIELHLSDARVDIVAEGIDVALRIGDLADSSLRARRLDGINTYLVAAPSYVAAHGAPAHPSDLARHRALRYSNVTAPWRFRREGEAEVAVRPIGPLAANSGDAGALVSLLEAWHSPVVGLHLLTPPSPLRPARVETLIRFLTERLRDPSAEEAVPHAGDLPSVPDGRPDR